MRVWAAVRPGRQQREAGLRVDSVSEETGYFLWIALPFISLQINLVIAGDSVAATAGPFSAVSVLCAFLVLFICKDPWLRR